MENVVAMWHADESRMLFKILVEMKNAGNTTTIDWRRVESIYNSQASTQRKSKQMVNHYNTCKGKWTAWTEMNKLAGIAFNEYGLPTEEELHSERLQEFIQKHTTGGAGKYVTKNKLPDLDIWCPVFGGTCATGNVQAYGGGMPSQDTNWSRSSIKISSSKRRKIGEYSSSKEKKFTDFDKAFVILNMTHEKKVFNTLSEMEQVKKRGPSFLGRCIRHLADNKLDRWLMVCTNDEERWEMISDVV